VVIVFKLRRNLEKGILLERIKSRVATKATAMERIVSRRKRVTMRINVPRSLVLGSRR